MKKLTSILLAVMLTVSLFAGCAPAAAPAPAAPDAGASAPETPAAPAADKPIVVGAVVNSLEHVYFNRVKAGMEEACAELGITLKLVDGAGDSAIQMAAVQDFIADGVDAIAVAWANTDGSGSIVELANQANIPFFCFDVAADGGNVISTVHTDNYMGGQMAAQYCLEKVLTDGKGHCVIIPYDEVESCRNRAQGFVDYMKEHAPEMKVSQIASFSGNRLTAYSNFQDALTSIGADNINFVFGVGDDAVLGAITACEEAGVSIPMIGLDGNPEAEQAVAAGGMFVADVAQAASNIGRVTIQTILDHLNGKTVESDILIAPTMITPENANPNAK